MGSALMLTRQKLGPELKACARPCSPSRQSSFFLRREGVPPRVLRFKTDDETTSKGK
jgi:hypothetical protein